MTTTSFGKVLTKYYAIHLKMFYLWMQKQVVFRHHHSLVQAGGQLEKEQTTTIESMRQARSGKEKGGGTGRLSSLHFLLFQTPLLLHFFSIRSRLPTILDRGPLTESLQVANITKKVGFTPVRFAFTPIIICFTIK